MPKIEPSSITEVKNATKLIPYVEQYVTLSRGGINILKGLCPFHDERTPSFIVNESTQTYHCYGCGEHGDIIDFIQEIEHLSFSETITHLAEQSGITLRFTDENGAGMADATTGRRALIKANEEITQAFVHAYNTLPDSHPAKLTVEGRGVDGTDEFGYGSEEVFAWALNKFGRGVLSDLGMVSERGNFLFSQRLMFIIRDTMGRPVAFSARALAEGQSPKYINSKASSIYQKSHILFGFDQAKRSRESNVFICEGQMDVLSLRAVGYQNAVAPCGTALTQEHVNTLLRKFSTLTFFFDPDEAGVKASKKALGLNGVGLSGRMVVNSGSSDADPNSILVNGGGDKLHALLSREHPALADAVLSPMLPLGDETPTVRAQKLSQAENVARTIADDRVRAEWLSALGKTWQPVENASDHGFFAPEPTVTEFEALVATLPTLAKETVQANKTEFERVLESGRGGDVLIGLLYDDEFADNVSSYVGGMVVPNPLWGFIDEVESMRKCMMSALV